MTNSSQTWPKTQVKQPQGETFFPQFLIYKLKKICCRLPNQEQRSQESAISTSRSNPNWFSKLCWCHWKGSSLALFIVIFLFYTEIIYASVFLLKQPFQFCMFLQWFFMISLATVMVECPEKENISGSESDLPNNIK